MLAMNLIRIDILAHKTVKMPHSPHHTKTTDTEAQQDEEFLRFYDFAITQSVDT